MRRQRTNTGNYNLINENDFLYPHHGKVRPFYSTNADYNTDSASYYEYLAKYNKLLNVIIDQLDDNTIDIDTIAKHYQKTIVADDTIDFNINDYSTMASAFLDYVETYLDTHYLSLLSNLLGGQTYDIVVNSTKGVSLINDLLNELFKNPNLYSQYTIHGHSIAKSFAYSGYLEIIGDNDNDVYYLTMDNYGSLVGNNIPNENLFKGQHIWTTGLYIEGHRFIPEEDRTILAFEGTSHLLDGSELNLSLQGYNTSQIERVKLRFGNFDLDLDQPDNTYTFEYSFTNGVNRLGYEEDLFYDWHKFAFPLSGNPDLTVDLNYLETVIRGHSGTDKKNVYLHAVEVLIFNDIWVSEDDANISTKISEEVTKMNTPIMSTNNLNGDEQEVFMLKYNPHMCYNIYDMTDSQLDMFREVYKKYVIQ